MLVLSGYNNERGDAYKIITSSVDIVILDNEENDVTATLIDDGILQLEDGSNILETIFGAGLAFLSLCAMGTPLFDENDIKDF